MSLDDITNAFAEYMEPSDDGEPMLMNYKDFSAALTSLNIPTDLFQQLYSECAVDEAPIGFEDFVSTISSAKSVIEEYEEPNCDLEATNQDIIEAFNALSNTNGIIDYESISRSNDKLQLKTRSSDLKAMLSMASIDGGTTIDFDTFCKLYQRVNNLSVK